MGYKVILSPLALEDLGQIVAYIAQHNPAAAERIGHPSVICLIAAATILSRKLHSTAIL